jgi:hypothetical protein
MCECEPVCPTAFRASCGDANYHCEVYRWVNTQNGAIKLDHSWVSMGVMTDKTLTADDSDIASLCIGGKAWICRSNVRGISTIGEEASIYDSNVWGTLHVKDDLYTECTVYRDCVTVCGDVTAKGSIFNAPLNATAEIICLSNTSTKDIHIQPTGPYYDPQVVRLSQGSVVNGNIYFHSNRGKVVLDDCSYITGEIYGGNVIKPFDCYNQTYNGPFYQALEN